MSHKSKGRKNLRNREAYPPMDEPVDVSMDAVEYADAYLMPAVEADARLWVGSADSAHE